MGFYINGVNYQFHLGNKAYFVHIPTIDLTKKGVSLISSDDFILTDLNGLYITAKQEVEYNNMMVSVDNYILQDLNSVYLTTKEDD